MRPVLGVGKRRAGVVVMSLLAAAAFTTNALADQTLVELISAGPAGGEAELDVYFAGASADGTRVFFETHESLVSADRDRSYDLYERAAGQTKLLSVSPSGPQEETDTGFIGASDDGTHVLFETGERLVSDDTDGASDVYERAGDVTTLVSTGPADAPGGVGAQGYAISADGSRALFESSEVLVSSDTNDARDVYERYAGQTTLLSTGATPDPDSLGGLFGGASSDGATVYFDSGTKLLPEDTDSSVDVYARSGGQLRLVSTGPNGGNGGFHAYTSYLRSDVRGVSDDGSRVLFTTKESLVAADTDSLEDTYEHAAGQTKLVTTGPAGANGQFTTHVVGASEDLSRIFFVTTEPLVSGDTDAVQDVYERSGDQTTLVSTAPSGGNSVFYAAFGGSSADGTHVFFKTQEPMVSDDTDENFDIYERAGNQTTLVSTAPDNGNGSSYPPGYDAEYAGATRDGARVFFETREPLVIGDSDFEDDVYERASGQTQLISTDPTETGFAGAYFNRVSDDGARIFFTTLGSMNSADQDSSGDVYVRRSVPTTPPPLPTPPPSRLAPLPLVTAPDIATFTGSPKSVRVSKTGRFAYRFAASPGRRGRVRLASTKLVQVGSNKRKITASKSFVTPSNGRVKAAFKLSTKNLKALKRRKTLICDVNVTVGSTTFTAKVKLNRPKRR